MGAGRLPFGAILFNKSAFRVPPQALPGYRRAGAWRTVESGRLSTTRCVVVSAFALVGDSVGLGPHDPADTRDWECAQFLRVRRRGGLPVWYLRRPFDTSGWVDDLDAGPGPPGPPAAAGPPR